VGIREVVGAVGCRETAVNSTSRGSRRDVRHAFNTERVRVEEQFSEF
jgi:hypothetical protein